MSGPGDTTLHLPPPLGAAVGDTLGTWQRERRIERLWARDATLWTDSGEDRWLGWLDIGDRTLAVASELAAFARGVRDDGFRSVLLLGMGGSSLCPEVLTRTFGMQEGYPRLVVLDSTDPEAIRRIVGNLDLAATLVVVASKSGTTLEPNLLLAHATARLRETVGDAAGRHLVAITDPGSQLEGVARDGGYRAIFHGEPTVGGRFSALSVFGMLPAALMGLDLPRLLGTAAAMAGRCRLPGDENPGLVLGAAIGTAALAGRDKLTFLLPPEICDLGGWLEQLVAESTGKSGRAIVPIDDEPLAAPGAYGTDRLFVVYRVGDRDRRLASHAAALVAAGQPVLEIVMEGPEALAAEFFRWEIATAVAGAVLGVNPFDQPDVEAAKIAGRRLTAEFERTGTLPVQPELLRDGDVTLRTDAANAEALHAALGGAQPSLTGYLRAHLRRIGPGDYLALLAFLDLRDRHRRPLQAIRTAVRDRTRAATSVGFGPRFLHSTGQAHKGGPDSAVVLQITYTPRTDLPVPDSALTFGTVLRAQAGGDLAVLLDRGRRALQVHLDGDTEAALARLAAAVDDALAGL